jgi:hypothetical protein
MFCPKCKAEFREGFNHCKECNLDLVESLPEDPPVEHFRPAVVFTTSNILEAQLVKSLLEGNGVTVFLVDGQFPAMNPFYTNAIGGIKLAVSESELEEAKEILAENRCKEGLDPSYGAVSPFKSVV